jgi:TolA-binding protein
MRLGTDTLGTSWGITMDTDLEAVKAFEKSVNVNADALIKALRQALEDEMRTVTSLRQQLRKANEEVDRANALAADVMRRCVELQDELPDPRDRY